MTSVFDKCESCGNRTDELSKIIGVQAERVLCYGCALDNPAPRFPLYAPNESSARDIARHKETLGEALTRRAHELSDAFKDFKVAEAKLAVADSSYKRCLAGRKQLQ